MDPAQKLKAVVRDGRLTLDEPTNLPEGEVIELVPVDDPYAHLDGTDEMDEEDHAKLNETIDTAWKNYKAGGKTYPAEEVIAQLRAKE